MFVQFLLNKNKIIKYVNSYMCERLHWLMYFDFSVHISVR